jgi:hypothetical protein
MSDIDGGAAAPADSQAVATNDPVIAATPNPVSAEPLPEPVVDPKAAKPEVKPEAIKDKEPKPAVSTRDALRKAAEKVAADSKEPAKDQKPTENAAPIKDEGQPRADDGKFAPKEPAQDAKPAEPAKDAAKPASDATKPVADAKPAAEQKPTSEPAKPAEAAKETLPSYTASPPPKRFSPDAKDAWASAPEPVRAEVARMERELTAGFEKHRAGAEAFESVREFDEMAKQSGTDLKTALTNYTNMEKVLRADPLKGLELICQNAGLSLRDVAAHVMGQTPEEHASKSDATIRELRAEITSLKQQVGTVASSFEQQRTQTAQQKVEAFAADPAHARPQSKRTRKSCRSPSKIDRRAIRTLVSNSNALLAVLKAQGPVADLLGPAHPRTPALQQDRLGGLVQRLRLPQPRAGRTVQRRRIHAEDVRRCRHARQRGHPQQPGLAQLKDVMEAHIAAAEQELEDVVDASLHSNGTGFGGKELGGLQLAIPTRPTPAPMAAFRASTTRSGARRRST